MSFLKLLEKGLKNSTVKIGYTKITKDGFTSYDENGKEIKIEPIKLSKQS